MFYRAKHEPGSTFVYAIFGVQYRGAHPEGRQLDLIKRFNTLIKDVTHYDRIIYPGKQDFSTQIWLSYWKPEKLETWWANSSVSSFWNNLPNDAGVWREFLTVDTRKSQNACTAQANNGVNGLDQMETFSDNIGYWGCVRARMPNSTLTPDEKYNNDLQEVPKRKPENGTIRPGRTVITRVPDNICFLVEGQDHSAMTPEEKKHWDTEFDELVTGWMVHLGDKAVENGLLDVRMGYVPEKGTFRTTGPTINLNHNRKIELFYWLDLRKFERAGRVHMGHVKLRKKWMEHYSPGGPMGSGLGKTVLWEETAILRGDDVEAEYVGCREGTGFMGYDQTKFIVSRRE